MPTDPISSAYVPPAYQPKSSPSSSLDKDGFLKMLSAQMRNQDPQSNQDPSQYFQTISMMTMVEQTTNQATNSTKQLEIEKKASAEQLVGRTVTYIGGDGLPITGTVDSAELDGKNGPTVTVAGVGGIDPFTLSKVA